MDTTYTDDELEHALRKLEELGFTYWSIRGSEMNARMYTPAKVWTGRDLPIRAACVLGARARRVPVRERFTQLTFKPNEAEGKGNE